MGVLLISFAASSLFVACGDEEEASCLVDSDCYDDEMCNLVTETCALDCTTSDVCEGDEVCAPGFSETGSVCVFDDSGTEPQCTIDDDCPGEETCSDLGFCEGDDPVLECETSDECADGLDCIDNSCVDTSVQETYFFAQIVDATDDAAACDVTDPGSDIFGVELVKDSADGSKAYAYAINGTLADRTGGEPNLRNDFFSVLDGTPSGFSDVCPTDFDETFSLGCGGDVVVDFRDENGQKIEIATGDTIRVLEYGGSCSGGTDADAWEVNVCASSVTEGALTGDSAACNGTAQGEGFGVGEVTVSL